MVWLCFQWKEKNLIISWCFRDKEAPNTLVYVAAVSAGNNFEVGNMIAETMNKAG